MVLGCEYPQWFHEIVTLLLHNLQISLHKKYVHINDIRAKVNWSEEGI
jgi:hypothetical protein